MLSWGWRTPACGRNLEKEQDHLWAAEVPTHQTSQALSIEVRTTKEAVMQALWLVPLVEVSIQLLEAPSID